jgi:hypothetical protein
VSLFDRSTLAKAFPDQPRLRADFEALADSFDAAQQQVNDLLASAIDLQARLQTIESSASQPYSALLDAISSLPDSDLGVIEKVGNDQVILHEIDSGDDTCLVPRSKLMSYVGKGATGARPTLSAQRRAVYFDTTLAANGKPVFWTGSQWLDATGTAV